MSIYEKRFERKWFKNVVHTTLNPNEPGSIRLHLVPPKFSFFKARPSTLIINGKDLIPLNSSWAILLYIFIDEVNMFFEKEINKSDLEEIVTSTINRMKKIYKKTSEELMRKDLWYMIEIFVLIARGEKVDLKNTLLSVGDFSKIMIAPHRMDLMVSSMKKMGKWNCNQKCLHCYAAEQEYAETKELSTEQWKKIIDICKMNCISQLTFTGGEPTLRDDLVELVNYSKWFVTRINTNGVLLSKELCEKLYDASLDSVQITLYSDQKEIHNELVGTDNFEKTVQGIKNAIESGLNVSINTPLCSLNKDYKSTLEFIHNLGITYATVSGLICTGNAKKEKSIYTRLKENELENLLEIACEYAEKNKIELDFTSPGWISTEKLSKLKLNTPACGACLSNMAISPDGNVMPCQSWLSKNSSLGNILEQKWKRIWNGRKCKKIRQQSSLSNLTCPLRGGKLSEE